MFVPGVLLDRVEGSNVWAGQGEHGLGAGDGPVEADGTMGGQQGGATNRLTAGSLVWTEHQPVLLTLFIGRVELLQSGVTSSRKCRGQSCHETEERSTTYLVSISWLPQRGQERSAPPTALQSAQRTWPSWQPSTAEAGKRGSLPHTTQASRTGGTALLRSDPLRRRKRGSRLLLPPLNSCPG